MKILFLNAYFYPEATAFAHLEKDLIEGLLEAGHELMILCPIPTRGISKQTAKRYRRRKKQALYGGRVLVRRFWAPRERRRPLSRALRYFWCSFREYGIGKKYQDTDLVFAASTPPVQGLLAGRLAKRLGCPFVYSLQDIFPDSLVTAGMAKKNSLLWGVGRAVENRTYQRCSRIIVPSKSMEENIKDKGVKASNICCIPNWVDTDIIKPVAREQNPLLKEYGIDPELFLVVYAGNFGAAQGADLVIRTAKLLQEHKDILFVVFGGGQEFGAAMEEAKRNCLSNIRMYGLLPQERVAQIYSLGDVALITCKPGAGSSAMPSKTWSIMACNTPILAAFDTDSELAQVLEQGTAGKCVEPGNEMLLAKAILDLKRQEKRECFSREYLLSHAFKENCVSSYIKVMESLWKKKRKRL